VTEKVPNNLQPVRPIHFIGNLIVSLFLGGLAAAVLNVIAEALFLNHIKITLLINQLGRFLLPALIFIYFQKRVINASALDLHRLPGITTLLLSLLLLLVSFWMIQYIYGINRLIPLPDWMVEQEAAISMQTKVLLRMDTVKILIVNVLLIGLLPALGEELFFRRIIQRYLQECWGHTLASIVVTAILFSAIHMQFQGFIPRFILGILIGYAYWASQTLWVPIIMHFLYNGIQVLLYYLFLNGVLSIDISEPFTVSIWEGILSGMLTLAIGALIYKRLPQKNLQSDEYA